MTRTMCSCEPIKAGTNTEENYIRFVKCERCRDEEARAREAAEPSDSYVDFLRRRIKDVCAELGVEYFEGMTLKDALGDEVRLSELSEGDRVLVYGVVHDRVGELGKVGVRLPNGNDCVKWFRPSDKVIYNGRVE